MKRNIIIFAIILHVFALGKNKIVNYLGPLSNGLSLAVNNENKYGYVNLKGDVIIPFEYDFANNFLNNVAVVQYGEGLTKTYLIDRRGNKLNKTPYDEIYYNEYFNTGDIIEVKGDGYFGVIDKKGNNILPVIYDCINISNEIIEGEKNGKKTFYDSKGVKLEIPLKNIDSLFWVESSLYELEINGNKMIYDMNQKKILTKNYSYFYGFVGNKGLVSRGENYYKIDKKGKELLIFKINFKEIYTISDNYIIGRTSDNESAIFDWNGKKLFSEECSYLGGEGNERFIYGSLGEYGLLNEKFEKICEKDYYNLTYLSFLDSSVGDYYSFKKYTPEKDTCGVIDKNNNIIFEKDYDFMQSFSEGHFIIIDKDMENIGYVDLNGNENWIGKIGELSSRFFSDNFSREDE